MDMNSKLKEKSIYVIGVYLEDRTYIQYNYDDFDSNNIIVKKDEYTDRVFSTYDYNTALEIVNKNGLGSDCIFIMIRFSNIESVDTPNKIDTIEGKTYYSNITYDDIISILITRYDTREDIINYIKDIILDKHTWYHGTITEDRVEFIIKSTLEVCL